MNVIGIDVGQNGAAVVISDDSVVDVFRFKNTTEMDIAECFSEWFDTYNDTQSNRMFVFIEKVHSMPHQGVASSFKFGTSFGFIIGVLTALKIPFEYVTPQKWQKALNCETKGNKNVTKAKAQQLFPSNKWTHADADAVLIAEYGRRKLNGVL